VGFVTAAFSQHISGNWADQKHYGFSNYSSQHIAVFQLLFQCGWWGRGKIIRDALTCHLEENGLIGASQHGFRQGKSCTTNLLEFLEKVTTSVERGESV
jgi:hypothetical protein